MERLARTVESQGWLSPSVQGRIYSVSWQAAPPARSTAPKRKEHELRAYADNDYPADHKPDWKIISGLWPYLAEFRGRVALALALLVLAELATVATPSP